MNYPGKTDDNREKNSFNFAEKTGLSEILVETHGMAENFQGSGYYGDIPGKIAADREKTVFQMKKKRKISECRRETVIILKTPLPQSPV